jgi:LEM3 (ligand-effect modulator 3) family / CDC50 family
LLRVAVLQYLHSCKWPRARRILSNDDIQLDLNGAAVRKFYGQFHQGLKKGDQLQFTVLHQYNTYDFGGEKSLLFTTQSAFGNRNLTFGLVWLVMGVLCGIITVTYIILGREQLMDQSVRRKNLERWWRMGETTRH